MGSYVIVATLEGNVLLLPIVDGGYGRGLVLSQDTKEPQSAAERMRRYRNRQKRGFRIVRIQIGVAEIEGLIERGYLSRGDKENVKAVEFATNDFVFETLLGS
jgi:hypothetical protein